MLKIWPWFVGHVLVGQVCRRLEYKVLPNLDLCTKSVILINSSLFLLFKTYLNDSGI